MKIEPAIVNSAYSSRTCIFTPTSQTAVVREAVPFEEIAELFRLKEAHSRPDYSINILNAAMDCGDIGTIFVDDTEKIMLAKDDIHGSLKMEFDVSRLNCIHHMLWWAGRPIPARPLHRQVFLGRTIVVTEQADLHLVWSKQTIFVKPLPSSLLSYRYWERHICDSTILSKNARGFLLSYIWLIQYESDLRIAQERGLLPQDIDWPRWKRFVKSTFVYIDPNTLENVNTRYAYGELRLSRLNQIYRLSPQFGMQHFLRGYRSGYCSYGDFFRSFGWVIVVFAFITTMLSSFQVGLATNSLNSRKIFQQMSEGFAVLCITVPMVLAAFFGWLYISLFIFHFIITVRYNAKKGQKRRRWLKEKEELV